MKKYGWQILLLIHDLQLDRLQYLADCRRGKRGEGCSFPAGPKIRCWPKPTIPLHRTGKLNHLSLWHHPLSSKDVLTKAPPFSLRLDLVSCTSGWDRWHICAALKACYVIWTKLDVGKNHVHCTIYSDMVLFEQKSIKVMRASDEWFDCKFPCCLLWVFCLLHNTTLVLILSLSEVTEVWVAVEDRLEVLTIPTKEASSPSSSNLLDNLPAKHIIGKQMNISLFCNRNDNIIDIPAHLFTSPLPLHSIQGLSASDLLSGNPVVFATSLDSRGPAVFSIGKQGHTLIASGEHLGEIW